MAHFEPQIPAWCPHRLKSRAFIARPPSSQNPNYATGFMSKTAYVNGWQAILPVTSPFLETLGPTAPPQRGGAETAPAND